MKYEDVTEKVINIFYKVYNTLGYGFLEKVYENAMITEFEGLGVDYANQGAVKVYYEGHIVGDYVADFIVENKVIVELKAIRQLTKADENQLLNYLTATDLEVGLLLNYGEKPEIKRKVFDNELKGYKQSNNSL
ncbi:MAG: GxxExxY protein [bacterium]|nr:GxxExxY protein [bacterium]